jgi:hypothetical protein
MLNELFQIYLRLPSTAIINLNTRDYYITNSLDAFGMAPFHRFSERSSQQHGVTDLGFRLDPRVFNLHMSVRSSEPYLYWYYRDQLCQFFRPSNSFYTIFCVLPNGLDPDLTRSIDCYLQKGLTFDTTKRKGLVQDFDVTLIAPDPTWYDPVLKSDTLQINPGSGTLNLVSSYAGSWRCYPTIEIVGPITNPLIVNTYTSEQLGLTYAVAEGETVTIDTAFGQKTVKNQAGTNLISKLTAASDLASFHIDPEDYYSHNEMHVSGVVPAAKHAHVTVKFYDRYIGI